MAKFKFYIIQIQSTKLNVLAGHIFVPGEKCAAVAVILACAADFVVRLVCRKHSRRGIPRTSGSRPFSREGEVTGCSALDASACAKHACVNRIIHHGIRVTTLQGVKTGSTNLYLMSTFFLFRNGAATAAEAGYVLKSALRREGLALTIMHAWFVPRTCR